MNNLFDLKRFGMLFRKHMAEHLKSYLMSLAVLCGMLVLLLGLYSFPSGGGALASAAGQFAFFMLLLQLSGTIFTSTIFMDLSEKKRAVYTLTLPASSFEKYLVGWVLTVLVFPIVYMAAFYAVDLPLIYYFIRRYGIDAEVLNIFSDREPYYVAFVVYAFLNSIALFGAVFFQKMAFIKTAFFFFLSVIALSLVNKYFLKLIIGEAIYPRIPFGGITVRSGTFFSVWPDEQVQQFYLTALAVSVTLLFWLAAFFRLKEKEI